MNEERDRLLLELVIEQGKSGRLLAEQVRLTNELLRLQTRLLEQIADSIGWQCCPDCGRCRTCHAPVPDCEEKG